MASTKKPAPIFARPPIVAVLGHIDHGKTSLLDKIRETDVQARETKGITQHIGASEVSFSTKNSELRTITFIDTPGHAAFSKMRSRGANVADLAILVVAADEGFRLQTKESWEHIKASGLPCVIALNKIDLPAANLEGAKESLFQNDIPLEEGGGDVPVLPVSAKTGEGLPELLDLLLLVAEMNQVSGRADAPLEAVIIESKLDKSRGPVATLVVRAGRLAVGEEIWAGRVEGKLKALRDSLGKTITEVLPGHPAEVLGFKEVPEVGSPVRQTPANPEKTKPALEVSDQKVSQSVESEDEQVKDKPRRLKLVLKADVKGTLEAIKQALPAGTEIITENVGDFNESDVLQASATGASLVGFRIKTSASVKKLAEIDGVGIHTFQTIYELLEWVEETVKELAKPIPTEEILGRAEIIAEFESGRQKIAGAVVREGRIAKKDRLRLERGQDVLGQVRVRSLKVGKEDVNLVSQGSEFGIVLDTQLDFAVGDMLVFSRSLPV